MTHPGFDLLSRRSFAKGQDTRIESFVVVIRGFIFEFERVREREEIRVTRGRECPLMVKTS